MKKKLFLLDEEKTTEVVTLTSKILKILYFVMIVGLIYLAIRILKEFGILTFFFKFIKILSPLFIGFIIAWLFNPLVTKLSKKGMPRVISSVIVYVLFLGLIFIFLRLLIPTLSTQINDLINSIPSVLNSIQTFIAKIFTGMKNINGFNVGQAEQNVVSTLTSFATNISSSLPNALIKLVTAFVSGFAVLAIGLVIGFYMLFNFNSTNDHLMSLLPKKYRYETRILIEEISAQLHRYINGVLLIAAIMSVTCSIGFWIAGLKAPYLFGVFCGITDIIPYVGPYMGGIPAVLVGFSQSSTVGIVTIIVIFVIQALENYLLQPVIMSKTMKLHPVTIMIGLIVFGYFFGIWGMVLATPTIALLKILFTYFINKYNLFNYDEEATEVINVKEINKQAKTK